LSVNAGRLDQRLSAIESHECVECIFRHRLHIIIFGGCDEFLCVFLPPARFFGDVSSNAGKADSDTGNLIQL